METSKCLDGWSVMMSELSQGRELAKQLQNHLDPSTPLETRQFLIQKILQTYNKLLHITNVNPCNNSFLMDSSLSQINFQGGATSKSSPPVSPCLELEIPSRASKRRKTLPKWVKTVKADTDGGVSDGYSWRKYGQKAIHGSTYPRGYYRCTHRHTRGCYATKQVQKSTEDPTFCQVIYKGYHTCTSEPSANRSPPRAPRGPLHPLKPEAGPAQPNKVEIEDPEGLDIDTIFASLITGVASPATSDSGHLPWGNAGGWTPESEQGGSGPDSRFARCEFMLDGMDMGPCFTLEDLEWLA